jgi:adenylate kinase family enzyme
VQQFAWLVERSTSQERMAIWADDLRFNTLCLALKELLEGKNKSDIPEELKQQLSVIKKKSLPSTESKSYQSKSYQIDEKKFKEWRDFFDYWTPDNQ